MMRKIAIVSATPFEIKPFMVFLDAHFSANPHHTIFTSDSLEVTVLVTGVGMVNTALSIAALFTKKKYDLVINAGVAGAFCRDFVLGEVVQVVSERYGDLGVEEADGRFTDMCELDLIESNGFPFMNGVLLNPNPIVSDMRQVAGLTVNKVHGYEASIEAIRSKYSVDVESMEGGAFFQACLVHGIPFVEIRGISNYVEKRNRGNWEMGLAIQELNKRLEELVKQY